MPKRLFHLRPWRRHSVVLAVAGAIYVAYGVALSGISNTEARTSTLRLAAGIMDVRWWGIVWMVVGVLALASTRWPPQSETWGYGAMAGLSAFWSAAYGLGVFLMGAPANGLTAMLVWGMVTFMWWGISGLMNPDDEVPHRPVVFDWSIYAPTHRGRTKQLTDQPSQRTQAEQQISEE